jgi:hypothetical protein
MKILLAILFAIAFVCWFLVDKDDHNEDDSNDPPVTPA